MKLHEVVDRARAAARNWNALYPTREISESVLYAEYADAVPRRDRVPGDDAIFKATFRASVARLRSERRVAVIP